jgi:hypothetical protein
MKTYIISYDIVANQSSEKYNNLISLIQTASSWAKPLESVWLIRSDKSASEIIDILIAAVDSVDQLIVIELNKDWASFSIDREVTDWMHGNI